MSSETTSTPGSGETLAQRANTEQKILAASAQAAQVAGIFSPAVSQAISLGVEAEPVVSGLVHLIIGLFHHHTGTKKPGAPAAK